MAAWGALSLFQALFRPAEDNFARLRAGANAPRSFAATHMLRKCECPLQDAAGWRYDKNELSSAPLELNPQRCVMEDTGRRGPALLECPR